MRICPSCRSEFEPRGPAHRYCTRTCRPQRSPEQRLLDQARARARRAGLEFYLSLEDVQIPERCPVTGLPLLIAARRGGIPQSPTLFRVNPAEGFVAGNVQVMSLAAVRQPKPPPLKARKGPHCDECKYERRMCDSCREFARRDTQRRYRQSRGYWTQGEVRRCRSCGEPFQPLRQNQWRCHKLCER